MNVNNGITQYVNSMSTYGSSSESLTGNAVSALKEGQIFEGTINSIEDGRVTIGLSNGQSLTARLDAGVNIVSGQSLFFQVKSNDGSLIQIKPVSLNLESNPTLLKALDLAGIGTSEKSVSMVNSMMLESMPISSDSINSMYKTLLQNPSVNPETAVLMTKFQIDVTPENAAMFENYANDRASLLGSVDQLVEAIPAVLGENSIETAAKINGDINKILNSFVADTNELSQALSQNGEENFEGIVLKEDYVQPLEQEITKQALNVPAVEENSISSETAALINTETSNDVIVSKDNTQLLSDQAQMNSDLSLNKALTSVLSDKQISFLNDIFSQVSDAKEKLAGLLNEDSSLNENVSSKEVFSQLSNLISSGEIPDEAVNRLFKSSAYKSLLKNAIDEAFSIEPKELKEKDALSNLYKNIVDKTNKLEALLNENSSRSLDGLKNAASNIRNNVSFMNSANELYNFVQIPLKMFDQNTESTLYVRQNKRGGFTEGDELTAYLHFDMDYLGSTDIYIKMKDKNVDCKWTLEDESSLKLIEDNIDILNQRLNKKGFNCSMSFSSEASRPDFVENFLKADVKSSELVHRYSFDMRA